MISRAHDRPPSSLNKLLALLSGGRRGFVLEGKEAKSEVYEVEYGSEITVHFSHTLEMIFFLILCKIYENPWPMSRDIAYQLLTDPSERSEFDTHADFQGTRTEKQKEEKKNRT